jgi:hypothetical protein
MLSICRLHVYGLYGLVRTSFWTVSELRQISDSN